MWRQEFGQGPFRSGLNGQRPSSGRPDTKRGISSVESPVDAPAVSSLIMGEYLAGYWQSPANGRFTRLKEKEKMSLDRTQCCVEGWGCYLLVLAHVKESLKYMPNSGLVGRERTVAWVSAALAVDERRSATCSGCRLSVCTQRSCCCEARLGGNSGRSSS